MLDADRVFADYATGHRPGIAALLRASHLDIIYTHGEGDSLIAADGTRILDLVGGFGSALFGHHHPELVRVVRDGLDRRVPFVAQGSIRPAVAALAQRLSALIGTTTGRRYVVTFGSTGADAVEGAIRHATVSHHRALATLADQVRRDLRRANRDGYAGALLDTGAGRQPVREILAESSRSLDAVREHGPVFLGLSGAFHGKTAGAFALTDQADAPDDLVVPGPNRLFLESLAPADIVAAGASELHRIARVIPGPDGRPRVRAEEISSVAAVFAEPVQGEGGVREVAADTLRALRELADRHGAALVFDEIQCGMGRTGTFSAAEPTGVRADYYLLSKSLGGGLVKISALLVDSTLAVDDFGRHHTSTFGDDDPSAEVALAVLDLAVDALPHIRATGARLRERLDELARRHPRAIAQVRGRGLLQGIELRPVTHGSALVRELCAPDMLGYVVAGYLLHHYRIRMLPTLSAPTTLRIQPSIGFADTDIDRLVTALDAVAHVLERGDYAHLLAHLTDSVTTIAPVPQRRPRAARARSKSLGAPRRIAFLANLGESAELRRLAPELADWSDAQFGALFERIRGVADPFEISRTTIDSPTGARVELIVIAVPVTAAQITDCWNNGQRAWVRDLVLDGVEHAVAAGAEVIGLGGYTSIVTDAAREVVEDDVTVTSGNSLTAACAFDAVRTALTGAAPGRRRVGVLGGLGNIGAVMAELIAPHAEEVLLVGRPGSRSRLEQVAARLPEHTRVSEDLVALRDCDIVVTATNAAVPPIIAELLVGAGPMLVCDLAVPGDVAGEVAELAGISVLAGGRIRLPLNQAPELPELGLAPGVVYACLAETLALGFEPATASPSYGALSVRGVRAARALAGRHGLRPTSTHPGDPPMATAPPILGSAAFGPDSVGGKAATLHELATEGFPVPPGFVVRAEVELNSVSDDELTAWVAGIGGFPVAVRSSGVFEDLDDASFAGQYDSYLEVGDVAALRDRIERCRESANNDRVRTYLSRNGFGDADAVVAVLVQRMVAATVAGVGFSIDPVTGNEDHALVECCGGLGERLVSGQVTPSRYTLRLRDGEVLDYAAGGEHIDLDPASTGELSRLLLAVQAFRHRPQDIEWALDDTGTVWLLQARAITAITWRTDIDQFSDADLRDGGISARVCTPLMFSLYDNAFQHSMQQFFTGLKLLDPAVEPDWMATYYGRAYWNVSAVKSCFRRIPGYDERHFDDDLGVLNSYGPDGPDRTPNSLAVIARALPVALAVRNSHREQLRRVDRFAAGWPAEYARWRRRAERLTELTDTAFAAELAECLLTFHADTERAYFTTIYHNSSVQSDVKQLIDKVDAATGGQTATIDLMGGLTDISHMALQRGILTLYRTARAHGLDSAAWDTALAEFLADQGFHADAELDLTCPRWSEDPDRVRIMIEAVLDRHTPPADPDRTGQEQLRRYEAAMAELCTRVRATSATRLRYARAVDQQVRRMRDYLVARERMREFSQRCYAIVRAYVVAAGARLAAARVLDSAEDVFMLSIHELVDLAAGRAVHAALDNEIRYRTAMYAGYRDLHPPHELGGGVSTTAAPATDGTLTGLGCSPGVAEGTARVISSLSEIDRLGDGDILVTRFTDPGWTPALGLVSAVVTEVGGLLSHAAVIGREYGIPAVLNVAGATTGIRSGQRIRVDGTTGFVTVLPDPTTEADHRASAAAPGRNESLITRKRLLCIAGADGSGKTTQIARLASAFETQGHSVAAVTIWDAFLDPAVSAKLPFANPEEVYAYLKVLAPTARAHFLFHAMHLALDLAATRGADTVLVNAYWYKYYATEVAHGGDPQVLRSLAAGFPTPDRVFHLTVRPDEALARKQLRSDYESGYGDDQEFLSFQERSHAALDALSSEFDWVRIDGTAPVAEITATVLEQLQRDDR